MPDLYAVFGHPVNHSRSADVHHHFAEQTGEDILYQRIDPGSDGFAQGLMDFLTQGGCGANVTLPFKQTAFELSDSLSVRAQQAGSVNTLERLADGTILGDNTDGAGLIRDLQDNLGMDLRQCRTLLLGAGGAARGVIAPLLGAGVSRLHIANRSADKAAALAMRFQDQGSVSGGPLAALPESPFDLIINATAASVHGEALDLPRTLLGSECLCYDMAYSDNGTPFTRWAERQGARTSDGWGMLIEQAAESFLLWRGIRPDTASLIKDRL